MVRLSITPKRITPLLFHIHTIHNTVIQFNQQYNDQQFKASFIVIIVTMIQAVIILIEIFTLTVFQMILYRGGLVETGARSSVHILETRFQIIKSTG
tara:strand:+ start:656 stop:946 length:291 start_codon:yes stop_codon:yes gene_type:complete